MQTNQSWRTPLVCLVALIASPAAFSVTDGRVQAQVSSPCGVGINPVVCENQKTGDPAAVWDVVGSGDAGLQGFATAMSVDQGQAVQFKVNTNAASYRLVIYRMGYYGGMGARKVATVVPSVPLPQTQPACLTAPATGLIDCGNWAVSAAWTVPVDAASGIYFARAERTDTGGASHIFFIVRDDDGRSDLLFQTSDTTWQAYNHYGGNSLYTGSPAGRAYKVSYNRPFVTRSAPSGGVQSWVFNSEYPMVRWLEANGYDVSYTTGIDTDRRAAELLEHRVFLSVGHDEYWSAAQRANVEAARGAGVALAFFSANEVFWKTRWEPSIDASATPYRTLVSYKETHANAKIDPTSTWTGTWRDPRFSPPGDGGRPENELTGTLFAVNGVRNDAITVPGAEGAMRFWRNTSIASLAQGQTATLPVGTLGYEWDQAPNNGVTPPGLIRLSSTTIDVTPLYLLDYGSTYGSGVATHSLTLYRHSAGALVFGAGTTQWAWGLDATHDRGGSAADQRMQQATVNLFADMGVQPGSIQIGLTTASPSLDSTAPSSTITFPAPGTTVQSGQEVIVTGTAQDAHGIVGTVEVSVDGGVTWRAATGRTNWSFKWTPTAAGPTSATLKSRAADDSGNLETPGTGVAVSIAQGGGPVAAYGFDEGTGTQVIDVSGNGNSGTISGATWTTTSRFGRALSFDGVNDWVTVNDANSLDLTNGMTLEAWINPVALGGWQTAILKETTTGLAYALYANDTSTHPSFTVNIGGERHTGGVTPLPLNSWTHVAATYDGAASRLYVNGTLISASSLTGSVLTSAGALRIGGNGIWGEFMKGIIDEVRIYRRALSAGEIQFDMTTPVSGQASADTTSPTVGISSPAAGSTVSGSTTVTASASDNLGVAGVQFLLDGASLGGEDVNAPYSIAWNTTAVVDGSHTLSARARDAAGNTATATNVVVTVSNAPDTVAPTVAVTAPAPGATVSGTVTVSANASDNVAVSGVMFLVDGVPIGTEDVTVSYSIAWNSASAVNGLHGMSARARDAAGNIRTSSTVTVTVSNTAPPPSTGLVAAYGFDEGIGTTANDVSGNRNAGAISGATWVANGRFGKALSFNGTSNIVTVPDAGSLDLTTGMTLEAWLNPTALGGWRSAIMKETSTALAYALYAHDNAPRPGATVRIGSADRTAPGLAALALNTWTHVAATYDGATLRLFVGGVEAGTLGVSGPLETSTGPLSLGGNAVWGEYFSGLIDEVRVYNRALTANEIQGDMTRAIGLGGEDAQPPSPPSSLTATGTVGSVSVAWTAATDNIGVVGYNVHRSVTSGFSPTSVNRIAQPPGTSYTDSGLAAETYYYLVTARDAAGNVGPASNQASATATADTTAPAVSVTNPAAGTTVSATIDVAAGATDNVGVAGVQFLVDGAPQGAEDTSAPYSISWDTRTAANGGHALAARARDASGNQTTSASVSVTVSNAPPPPAGLIAAYGFEEGVGTSIADATGKSHTGTISGATWSAAGKNGKALSFDGINDWVTIADANDLDLTNGMTLEAWVRAVSLSGWNTVVLKEGSGSLVYGLYANDNAPRPAVTMAIAGIDRSATGASSVPLNAWTHLAATYDGTTLRLYVNGVEALSRAQTGNMTASTNPLRIGGNGVWGEYFNGLVDDVRIYNRALTTAEIQADMNTPVQ